MMNAQEIIAYIGAAEKKTPVKIYVNERPHRLRRRQGLRPGGQ